MFRSNFSRYILTFGIMIITAFIAVTVIMCYFISGYARDTKDEVTYRLADIIFEDLEDKMANENKSFCAAVAEFNSQKSYSSKFAEMIDSSVFITDMNGTILYVAGDFDSRKLPYRIPKSVLKDAAANAGETHTTNFDGMLAKEYYCTAFPITSAQSDTVTPLGMLFISATTPTVSDTLKYMISTTVLALLWVFAVSFTALYFISERLNKPLLQLQKSLDIFSKGDFSVRMAPTGITEIDGIAESFNDMAASLEKIEYSRRSFLSNISHDLRTPMTGIQGFVDAILDGTVKPEDQKHYLTVISGEIKRLSRLVNTLLDVSRMESGKAILDKSAFDICEMTRLIIISLEKKLLEKNIEFNLETDAYRSLVFADYDAIYQVMYNLLDNAAKFTNEGGNIRVIIRKGSVMDSEDGKKYRISVYNTGEGISENDRKNVFDRFFKADFSRGIDKSGVGLGLFIVKTKLDMHGEKISVTGEYGSWCRFDFKLPSADVNNAR